MRLFIPIIFLLLFDWYAFQAFLMISEAWSPMAQAIFYSLYWLIPLLAIGTLVAASFSDVSKWNKERFAVFRAILIAAYFGKFLVILLLFFDDLRRLVLGVYQNLSTAGSSEIGRSKLLSQIAVFAGAIPFMLLSYGVFRNRYRYKIYKTIIELDTLPKVLDGFKIIQISDIHSGSFTQENPIKAGIEIINQQQADLVFFTGDLVNNIAREMEPYINIFNKIKAKYGVYSITGNHDYGDYVRWENPEHKRANFEELVDTHQKLGWDLLLNENRMLDIQGEKIAVIGVENYSAKGRFSKYGNLSKAYAGTEGAALKLLLSHDPSHWQEEVVQKFKDIAITFSGHTHGMQFGFEIPGWIKWSPVQYVYKQWAGLYASEKQYLYVNRGFGFLGYPGRVGILPEITVLELKKS